MDLGEYRRRPIGVERADKLAQAPYAALDRVEIVKGPTSALHGRGGLYGAVNYITRSPRENALTVAASVGSDDDHRGEAELSRGIGGGRVLAAASYEDYGGWRKNSRKQLLNLFGKFDVDLSPKTNLTVSLNYSDRDSEAPNAIPLDRNGEVIQTELNVSKTGPAGLRRRRWR